MTDHVRTYPALVLSWPPSGPDGLQLPDQLAVALDDLDVVAIHELDAAWRVSFASARARDRAAEALGDQFRRTALRVSSVEIPDEDWARRNQAHLQAVRIGELIIAPPWAEPAAGSVGAGRLIRIVPSMGFGTGHHATTRLCLRLLQEADLAGRSFFDIGTGSGVLAIAAWLLGARPVTAIDTDADAVESARENLRLNDVGDAVRLVTGDFRQPGGVRARMAAANLTGATLRLWRHELRACVEPGGLLVVSGFGHDEAAAVLAALAEVGSLAARREEDGWCAAMFRVSDGTGRTHD